MARGDIKSAFENVQQACEILQKALIKPVSISNNSNNKLIYQSKNKLSLTRSNYEYLVTSSPIYLEVMLWKSKIHNRQAEHDLALVTIDLKGQFQNQKFVKLTR